MRKRTIEVGGAGFKVQHTEVDVDGSKRTTCPSLERCGRSEVGAQVSGLR